MASRRLSIMRGCNWSRLVVPSLWVLVYLPAIKTVYTTYIYKFFLASLPSSLFALQMFIDLAFCPTVPLSHCVCVSVCLLSQRGANKAMNEPLTFASSWLEIYLHSFIVFVWMGERCVYAMRNVLCSLSIASILLNSSWSSNSTSNSIECGRRARLPACDINTHIFLHFRLPRC